MTQFNADYWDQLYRDHETAWDIGYPSPPLKTYIDQLVSRDLRILIPGGGNSYEAEYLLQQGFEQVHVVDISPTVCQRLAERLAVYVENGTLTIHCQDFFDHRANYDLLLEQTFFCTFPPALRPKYVEQVHRLTAPEGYLVGVLFHRIFEHGESRPPFGGLAEDYVPLFAPYFDFQHFALCRNSISARQGGEYFIKFKHKTM